MSGRWPVADNNMTDKKEKKWGKDMVPVIVPAGTNVRVGGVAIKLVEPLHGMASQWLMSRSASASRVLEVPDPAHIPESWKTKREFMMSSSSASSRTAKISSAEDSDEIKNNPASTSNPQKLNDDFSVAASCSGKSDGSSAKSDITKFFISLDNVKEHAPLSARASVDHGVKVETTQEHLNRAADRGCCVSTCSAILFFRD